MTPDDSKTPENDPIGHVVLDLKPGITLAIGPNVVLEVVRKNNGCLRLSIRAPRSVRILRSDYRPKQKTPGVT